MKPHLIGLLVLAVAAPAVLAGPKRPAKVFPWSESVDAALAEAQERNVPILVSLGKDH